jgi:hypothetical protein
MQCKTFFNENPKSRRASSNAIFAGMYSGEHVQSALFVLVRDSTLVSTLVKTTCAPTTTDPPGSVTRPDSVADSLWANTRQGNDHREHEKFVHCGFLDVSLLSNTHTRAELCLPLRKYFTWRAGMIKDG